MMKTFQIKGNKKIRPLKDKEQEGQRYQQEVLSNKKIKGHSTYWCLTSLFLSVLKVMHIKLGV